MGLVYKGIHEKIALKARDEFGLEALVETGTYKGETAFWAKDKFERVVTIELSPNLYEKSVQLIGEAHNVLMIQGDSREWLSSICRGRDNKPTLFWLDSHWTGDAERGDPKGCPLLDEIQIINETFFGIHVIMVDDYYTIKRLNWVNSDEIIRLLKDKANHDREVRIIDDIYFASHRIPEDFEEWKK